MRQDQKTENSWGTEDKEFVLSVAVATNFSMEYQIKTAPRNQLFFSKETVNRDKKNNKMHCICFEPEY